MLSPKLLAALNEQINAELTSAYAYLAMAAHFETANLQGSAKWMRRQAREEQGHAMRLFDFVHDCDGRTALHAIPQPQSTFATTLEVWEIALRQEQGITAGIHALLALAEEEKHYPTQVMLHWFVTEQVEEEKTTKSILEQVRSIGSSSSSIFYIDRHLGKEADKSA
jgi:ferritin